MEFKEKNNFVGITTAFFFSISTAEIEKIRYHFKIDFAVYTRIVFKYNNNNNII